MAVLKHDGTPAFAGAGWAQGEVVSLRCGLFAARFAAHKTNSGVIAYLIKINR
jgi:hypothetical protein